MKHIKSYETIKVKDVDDVLNQISDFINGPQRNMWIGDNSIKIYIRKSKRMANGQFLEFFDFASIEVYKTGQGLFTEILNKFEKRYPDTNIFIESVLTPRFANYIKNTLDFDEDIPNDSNNFYKIKSKDVPVKEGDYVIFNDEFANGVTYVKQNYPYKIKSIFNDHLGIPRAYIDCDDGEEKSFRAINSQVCKKISKSKAELMLQTNKYNL
jgi:hypothetical protein